MSCLASSTASMVGRRQASLSAQWATVGRSPRTAIEKTENIANRESKRMRKKCWGEEWGDNEGKGVKDEGVEEEGRGKWVW